MKNFKIIFSLIFLILIINTSCKNNDLTSNSAEFSKIIDLSKHEDLNNELGIYSERYSLHHGNVNIRATVKHRAYDNPSVRVKAWHFDNITNSNLNHNNGGEYFINDLVLTYNEKRGYFSDQLSINNYPDYDAMKLFIKNEILGKEINIKNIQNNDIVFEEKFYAPEQIRLTGSIENDIPSTAFVKMNRNDFTFDFNTDEKNTNGLLIHMVYSGEFYGMTLDDLANPDPANNLEKAIHLKHENNGKVTLPRDLFEGVPHNGIVTMYIGRGGAKLIQAKEKEHYINAFTEEQLRVVIE